MTEIPHKEYSKLIVMIVILIALAGIFILNASWADITGNEIRLETLPLSHSDVVKGEYVVLTYKINTIPLLEGAEIGHDIYISLQENEKGIWEYRSASLTKPSDVFILGRVISISDKNMNVNYGIEQYFVEKGSKILARNANVELLVSKEGKARIDEVEFTGPALNAE